ncbi:MAG: FtsX-like permease family protein [Candidatus Aminicenantes bacterium]|nr:FtsX-like permease family protein [Candidatus Aminicenantes bacterium]
MKVLLKLAIRNLLGAGLRTWLNVVVLSLTFVVIITGQGLFRGMGDQAARASIEAEYGGGQFWHSAYDPYNPLTIQDAHGPIPDQLLPLIASHQATPILIIQGTLYPQGRFLPVLIKGIDPAQNILKLPSAALLNAALPETKAPTIPDEIPAFIGTRMATTARLSVGDTVILRWRNAHGAFDARTIRIVHIFRTIVQSVDSGQVWIPLPYLQAMASLPAQATIITLAPGAAPPSTLSADNWVYRDLRFLLRDIDQLVAAKTVGSTTVYLILLFMALLAIFNSQVLNIFHRLKEIGTLVALGLTRRQIVLLFTLEGTLQAVLAAVLAALYGYPLLSAFARTGWKMPEAFDSFGIALGERLVPVFTGGIIIGTVILIMTLTAIISFMPARRLSQLRPTDALRGNCND